jgi:hypothetical protein
MHKTQANNIVLVTSSGQAVRASHVISCSWGKGDCEMRICLDTGEVVRDHWPTREHAGGYMERVRYAMQGLDVERPPGSEEQPDSVG